MTYLSAEKVFSLPDEYAIFRLHRQAIFILLSNFDEYDRRSVWYDASDADFDRIQALLAELYDGITNPIGGNQMILVFENQVKTNTTLTAGAYTDMEMEPVADYVDVNYVEDLSGYPNIVTAGKYLLVVNLRYYLMNASTYRVFLRALENGVPLVSTLCEGVVGGHSSQNRGFVPFINNYVVVTEGSDKYLSMQYYVDNTNTVLDTQYSMYRLYYLGE